jgi:hypothetical protein
MYKFSIIGLLSLLLSCQQSSDSQKASDTDASTAEKAPDTLSQLSGQAKKEEIKEAQSQVIRQPLKEVTKEPLKQYPDILTLIEATGDYDKQNGTFKLLAQKPLHIQLAKPTYNGDLEEKIRQQVMRDIVYVGFRTFAQTNVDEIKITSMPIKWDNPKHKGFDYLQEFKQTATLRRSKAESILEKYYGHADFSKLFGEMVDGTYQPEIPNMHLKRMMFNDLGEPTLDEVFAQLQITSHNLLPDS